MHACFQVYDVLEHICFQLASSNSLDALAKLARTCPIFLDPALNMLWHTIPTLEPLVRCLPGDAWVIKKTRYHPVLTLTRATTPQDWERCKFYTHRIRHFGNIELETSPPGKLKGSIPTDKTIYVALKATGEQPTSLLTFPNLRTCRLIPHTSSPSPYFASFLAPTLRTLTLRALTYDPDGMLPSILSSLAHRTPCLEQLRIEGVPDSSSYIAGVNVNVNSDHCGEIGGRGGRRWCGILMDMLYGLEYLRALECPCIRFPDDAVLYLATRTKIRVLHIKNTTEDIIDALSHGVARGECFEYLEQLSVECSPDGGLAEVTKLLGRVGNISRIQRMEVMRSGPGMPTERELRGFIQDLSNLTTISHNTPLLRIPTPNTNLKTLSIEQPFLLPSQHLQSNNGTPTTIQTLAPLLSGHFPALETLKISLDTGYSFNDADATTIACAWPKLQELQLGSQGYGWGLESGMRTTMTFSGLQAFARGCKGLRSLGVCFNAKPDSDTPLDRERREKEENEGRCSSLRALEVGDSAYEGEPLDVARRLLDIFPGLRGVYGPDMTISREWQQKWMQVSMMVNTLSSQRRVKPSLSTAGAISYGH